MSLLISSGTCLVFNFSKREDRDQNTWFFKQMFTPRQRLFVTCDPCPPSHVWVWSSYPTTFWWPASKSTIRTSMDPITHGRNSNGHMVICLIIWITWILLLKSKGVPPQKVNWTAEFLGGSIWRLGSQSKLRNFCCTLTPRRLQDIYLISLFIYFICCELVNLLFIYPPVIQHRFCGIQGHHLPTARNCGAHDAASSLPVRKLSRLGTSRAGWQTGFWYLLYEILGKVQMYLLDIYMYISYTRVNYMCIHVILHIHV